MKWNRIVILACSKSKIWDKENIEKISLILKRL